MCNLCSKTRVFCRCNLRDFEDASWTEWTWNENVHVNFFSHLLYVWYNIWQNVSQDKTELLHAYSSCIFSKPQKCRKRRSCRKHACGCDWAFPHIHQTRRAYLTKQHRTCAVLCLRFEILQVYRFKILCCDNICEEYRNIVLCLIVCSFSRYVILIVGDFKNIKLFTLKNHNWIIHCKDTSFISVINPEEI